MNSKNYGEDEVNQLIAIGKEVKLAFPGEFNEATDFAVGELSVLKGLWPIKTTPKEKPLFFPDMRRRYRESQAAYAIEAATEDLRIEGAIRLAEVRAAMNPRQIAQQIFLEEQSFQNAAKTNQLTNKLLDEASARNVDLPTYNAVRN